MEREVYNIEGQEYIVITQTKENTSNDNIYDIFVRYALEKINEKIR